MRLTVRGVTLAEALVATTLSAALVVTALGALAALQRGVEQHAERVALATTLGSSGQLIRAELANLSPVEGDVLAPSPDGLTYRAIRGSGMLCGTTTDGGIVRTSSFRSLRLPAAGRDSLLWLAAGSGDTMHWRAAALTGPPRTASCADGESGLALPAGGPMDAGGLANAPLRFLEVMELRAYRSGSETWLGLRSVSAGEAIQPATGPFDAGGVAFRYLDSAGAAARTPAEIVRIEVRLRGQGAVASAAGGAARSSGPSADSLLVVVPIRDRP